MIFVCSLARMHDTVERTGAKHLITLINPRTPVPRPASIREEDHLFLDFNDIVSPTEGMIAPGDNHVKQLLDYVGAWERTAPLVIHCFAGISRSSAGAFITACALQPGRNEAEIAHALRAASPCATPNGRLVALADTLLGRNGRMVGAIAAIGRGADAFEGVPFELALDAGGPHVTPGRIT